MEVLPCGSAASHSSPTVDPWELANLPLNPSQYATLVDFEELLDLDDEYRKHRRKVRAGGRRAFMRMRILYSNRCAYCGFSGGVTRDHVIPRCMGGPDDITNILPACRPCNAEKGGDPLSVWRYRVIKQVMERGLEKSSKRHIGIMERSKACFAPFPLSARQRRRWQRERALEMERIESDRDRERLMRREMTVAL